MYCWQSSSLVFMCAESVPIISPARLLPFFSSVPHFTDSIFRSFPLWYCFSLPLAKAATSNVAIKILRRINKLSHKAETPPLWSFWLVHQAGRRFHSYYHRGNRGFAVGPVWPSSVHSVSSVIKGFFAAQRGNHRGHRGTHNGDQGKATCEIGRPLLSSTGRHLNLKGAPTWRPLPLFQPFPPTPVSSAIPVVSQPASSPRCGNATATTAPAPCSSST